MRDNQQLFYLISVALVITILISGYFLNDELTSKVRKASNNELVIINER